MNTIFGSWHFKLSTLWTSLHCFLSLNYGPLPLYLHRCYNISYIVLWYISLYNTMLLDNEILRTVTVIYSSLIPQDLSPYSAHSRFATKVIFIKECMNEWASQTVLFHINIRVRPSTKAHQCIWNHIKLCLKPFLLKLIVF